MQSTTQKIGILAEQIAQKYLKDKAYKILSVNYKKPWGEVDIIAQKDNCINFVEVKASSQNRGSFGPELRVNKNKFFHIVRTAESFLQDNDLTNMEWQIDIVSVSFSDNWQKATIQHFKKINEDNFSF